MSWRSGFRRLWASNAASNLGDGISFVAIPLLATALTSDPLLVAGTTIVHSAVRLLVVLPVGAFVDRWDRRRVLWLSNVGRGVLLAVLALAVASGAGSIGVLYLVLALIGVLETAADNAALSILPALVDSDELDRANSRISGTQLVADEFVGPPLGGLLFAFAAAVPLAVTGGLYAAAGLVLLSLRGSFRAERTNEVAANVASDIADGVAWLRQHRPLRVLAVVGALASVGYMVPFSILVLFARDTLGLDPAGYGVLLSVSAVGGLLGAAATPALRRRVGYATTVTGSLMLGAAMLAAISLTTTPWVVGLCLAAYILHVVIWGICVNSLRQRLVPDALRGRVNAVFKLLGLIGLTVGALLGGVAASRFGLSAPFLVGGAFFVGCAAMTWPALRAWERKNADLARG